MDWTEQELTGYIEAYRGGLLSQSAFRRLWEGAWGPKVDDDERKAMIETIRRGPSGLTADNAEAWVVLPMKEEPVSKSKAEEEREQRIREDLAAQEHFMAEAQAKGFSSTLQDLLLAQYKATLAYDPARPLGPAPSVYYPRSGPVLVQLGDHRLSSGDWSAMCRAAGLTNVQLTFERGGSLKSESLRYRIVRQSDGQGLTGHITLTRDPERDWQLLMVRLADALEALAGMDEGAPYVKGPGM